MLSNLLWFPTSSAKIGKHSSLIDGLWSSCSENLSFPHKFPWGNPCPSAWVCMSSVFMPYLRVFDWILSWVSPHRFPRAGTTASFFDFHRIDWVSHVLRRVLPRTRRVVLPNSLALVLPSVNLHWSLLVLSLTWHSASWSDQKENYWNGCKRTSRNSLCLTNEEDGSTRHAWNSLG